MALDTDITAYIDRIDSWDEADTQDALLRVTLRSLVSEVRSLRAELEELRLAQESDGADVDTLYDIVTGAGTAQPLVVVIG